MSENEKPLSEIFCDLAFGSRQLANGATNTSYYEAQALAYERAMLIAAEREMKAKHTHK